MNPFIKKALHFSITEEGMTDEIREFYGLPPLEPEGATLALTRASEYQITATSSIAGTLHWRLTESSDSPDWEDMKYGVGFAIEMGSEVVTAGDTTVTITERVEPVWFHAVVIDDETPDSTPIVNLRMLFGEIE